MRKFLLFALPWLALTAVATAHAMLERADPPVGGTVHAAPRQVAITFSEDVEPAFSAIDVADAAGRRVDTGKPRTAAGNRRILEVDVGPLAAGSYKVTWHAVSVDTHRTQGSYGFTVAP